jgi:hypothetical protein
MHIDVLMALHVVPWIKSLVFGQEAIPATTHFKGTIDFHYLSLLTTAGFS